MSRHPFKVYLPGPGATPKFSTPQELADKVTEYFNSLIDQPVMVPDGAGGKTQRVDPETKLPVFETIRPLFYELVLYVGFHSLTSFRFQATRGPEWKMVVEAAMSYIGSYHEDNLGSGKNAQGSTFWLKSQVQWMDSSEVNVNNNHSGSIESVRKVVFTFKDMPNYLVKIDPTKGEPQNEEAEK